MIAVLVKRDCADGTSMVKDEVPLGTPYEVLGRSTLPYGVIGRDKITLRPSYLVVREGSPSVGWMPAELFEVDES